MSTHSHSTKAEQLMEREIDALDQTLRELLNKTVVVKQEKARLAKALKVLTGKAPKDLQGRVAPSLKHCQKAAEILFARKQQWPERELAQQMTAALASHPQLNKQGLSLRVAQYLKACDRHEQSGLLIAPRTDSQS